MRIIIVRILFLLFIETLCFPFFPPFSYGQILGGADGSAICRSFNLRIENECETPLPDPESVCCENNVAVNNATPSESLHIDGADHVVAPGDYISLTAVGGAPPYLWAGSDELTLVTAETAKTALFQAGEEFCGSGVVTVSDSCTKIAQVEVRATAGVWVQLADGTFDKCSPPGKGTYTANQSEQNFTSISGKYRAQIFRLSVSTVPSCGNLCDYYPAGGCCPVNNAITTTFDGFASTIGFDRCGVSSVYDGNGCSAVNTQRSDCKGAPEINYVPVSEIATSLWEWKCHP